MNPGSLPSLDAKERERPCSLPPGVDGLNANGGSSVLGKLVLTIDQCVWHELAKKDPSQHGAIGVSVSWLGEKGHDTFFRPSLLTQHSTAAAATTTAAGAASAGDTHAAATENHNRTNNALHNTVCFPLVSSPQLLASYFTTQSELTLKAYHFSARELEPQQLKKHSARAQWTNRNTKPKPLIGLCTIDVKPLAAQLLKLDAAHEQLIRRQQQQHLPFGAAAAAPAPAPADQLVRPSIDAFFPVINPHTRHAFAQLRVHASVCFFHFENQSGPNAVKPNESKSNAPATTAGAAAPKSGGAPNTAAGAAGFDPNSFAARALKLKQEMERAQLDDPKSAAASQAPIAAAGSAPPPQSLAATNGSASRLMDGMLAASSDEAALRDAFFSKNSAPASVVAAEQAQRDAATRKQLLDRARAELWAAVDPNEDLNASAPAATTATAAATSAPAGIKPLPLDQLKNGLLPARSNGPAPAPAAAPVSHAVAFGSPAPSTSRSSVSGGSPDGGLISSARGSLISIYVHISSGQLTHNSVARHRPNTYCSYSLFPDMITTPQIGGLPANMPGTDSARATTATTNRNVTRVVWNSETPYYNHSALTPRVVSEALIASMQRRVCVIEVWNKRQRQNFALVPGSKSIAGAEPVVMSISEPTFEAESGENSDECIGLAKIPMQAIAHTLQRSLAAGGSTFPAGSSVSSILSQAIAYHATTPIRNPLSGDTTTGGASVAGLLNVTIAVGTEQQMRTLDRIRNAVVIIQKWIRRWNVRRRRFAFGAKPSSAKPATAAGRAPPQTPQKKSVTIAPHAASNDSNSQPTSVQSSLISLPPSPLPDPPKPYRHRQHRNQPLNAPAAASQPVGPAPVSVSVQTSTNGGVHATARATATATFIPGTAPAPAKPAAAKHVAAEDEDDDLVSQLNPTPGAAARVPVHKTERKPAAAAVELPPAALNSLLHRFRHVKVTVHVDEVVLPPLATIRQVQERHRAQAPHAPNDESLDLLTPNLLFYTLYEFYGQSSFSRSMPQPLTFTEQNLVPLNTSAGAAPGGGIAKAKFPTVIVRDSKSFMVPTSHSAPGADESEVLTLSRFHNAATADPFVMNLWVTDSTLKPVAGGADKSSRSRARSWMLGDAVMDVTRLVPDLVHSIETARSPHAASAEVSGWYELNAAPANPALRGTKLRLRMTAQAVNEIKPEVTASRGPAPADAKHSTLGDVKSAPAAQLHAQPAVAAIASAPASASASASASTPALAASTPAPKFLTLETNATPPALLSAAAASTPAPSPAAFSAYHTLPTFSQLVADGFKTPLVLLLPKDAPLSADEKAAAERWRGDDEINVETVQQKLDKLTALIDARSVSKQQQTAAAATAEVLAAAGVAPKPQPLPVPAAATDAQSKSDAANEKNDKPTPAPASAPSPAPTSTANVPPAKVAESVAPSAAASTEAPKPTPPAATATTDTKYPPAPAAAIPAVPTNATAVAATDSSHTTAPVLPLAAAPATTTPLPSADQKDYPPTTAPAPATEAPVVPASAAPVPVPAPFAAPIAATGSLRVTVIKALNIGRTASAPTDPAGANRSPEWLRTQPNAYVSFELRPTKAATGLLASSPAPVSLPAATTGSNSDFELKTVDSWYDRIAPQRQHHRTSIVWNSASPTWHHTAQVLFPLTSVAPRSGSSLVTAGQIPECVLVAYVWHRFIDSPSQTQTIATATGSSPSLAASAIPSVDDRLIGVARVDLTPFVLGFTEIAGWYHLYAPALNGDDATGEDDDTARSNGQIKLSIVPDSELSAYLLSAVPRAASPPLAVGPAAVEPARIRAPAPVPAARPTRVSRTAAPAPSQAKTATMDELRSTLAELDAMRDGLFKPKPAAEPARSTPIPPSAAASAPPSHVPRTVKVRIEQTTTTNTATVSDSPEKKSDAPVPAAAVPAAAARVSTHASPTKTTATVRVTPRFTPSPKKTAPEAAAASVSPAGSDASTPGDSPSLPIVAIANPAVQCSVTDRGKSLRIDIQLAAAPPASPHKSKPAAPHHPSQPPAAAVAAPAVAGSTSVVPTANAIETKTLPTQSAGAARESEPVGSAPAQPTAAPAVAPVPAPAPTPSVSHTDTKHLPPTTTAAPSSISSSGDDFDMLRALQPATAVTRPVQTATLQPPAAPAPAPVLVNLPHQQNPLPIASASGKSWNDQYRLPEADQAWIARIARILSAPPTAP